MKLCILIPVLNEEQCILDNLDYYKQLQQQASLLFIDGNSSDNTITLLQKNHFQYIHSHAKGRGAQLHKGLSHDHMSECILFLHADTKLPEDFLTDITNALETNYWGRFNVKINSSKSIYRIIEKLMDLRSCITGIATGDQAIFARTDIARQQLNDLSNYPLMEDIYISRQLKNISRPACVQASVITSARYWEKHGVIKTIISMWWYRLQFYFGVPPNKLYKRYYR